MTITVNKLAGHYRDIAAKRMRGLPIVNTALDVEAVGFREIGDDQVGVLITPWFMNLVVLPGGDAYRDMAQGEEVEQIFPAGNYSFTVCRDEALGSYLTAILFRTVAAFPDQDTARDIATTILEKLFATPRSDGKQAPRFSRRDLFSRLGAG